MFTAELFQMIPASEPEDYIQLFLPREVDRVQYGPIYAKYVYPGHLNLRFALCKY